MIKAEIIRGGIQWRDRFHPTTFRAATVDALEQELPAVVDEARQNVLVSPFSKEHLRDTIEYGVDRQKGMGWIQAGGTRVVWYAHLIERGFTDRAGRYHPGMRFMGKAIQAHSVEIMRKLRSNLRRRLRHG